MVYKGERIDYFNYRVKIKSEEQGRSFLVPGAHRGHG